LEGVNPINTLTFKTEDMRKSKDRIACEVLKEIFPQKFRRNLASGQVYSHLISFFKRSLVLIEMYLTELDESDICKKKYK
jgi:hypothetical protein